MKRLIAAFAAATILSVPLVTFANDAGDWITYYDNANQTQQQVHPQGGIYYNPNNMALSVSGATISSIIGLQDVLDSKASSSHTFNYTTRTLNTCFQPSSTRDTIVNYSVDIDTTSTLISGQDGTVTLTFYTDSGCSTGSQVVDSGHSKTTQSLGLTVTLLNGGTVHLGGVIPAGKYAKIVTANTTGTPVFTSRATQETQL